MIPYRSFHRWWFLYHALSNPLEVHGHSFVSISRAGESRAARYQSSWLKQDAKVKITARPFTIYCDGRLQEDIRRRQGSNPPCSLSPEACHTGWGSGGSEEIWGSSLSSHRCRRHEPKGPAVLWTRGPGESKEQGLVWESPEDWVRVEECLQGSLPPAAARSWQRLRGKYLGKAPTERV